MKTDLRRFLQGTLAMPLCLLAMGLCATGLAVEEPAAALPAVGQQAADFELPALGEQERVKLSAALEQGPVVLVVLRGYPGYQCPICSRQVGSLIGQAEAFRQQKASVLLVYPGPGANLSKRGAEFLKETRLPAPLKLLLDPDYKFTDAYHLRWDAPRETAYPSTLVIDQSGNIRFAKISKSHGGRSDAKEILAALAELE